MDPGQVFCCSGCQAAYALIHGWGLEDFYALRRQMQRTGAAHPAGTAAHYEQFDTPEFLGASTPRRHEDGLCSTELAILGLHCSACAWLIERAAANAPGLKSVRVKLSDHSLRLIFDPAVTKLSRIARLLDQLGYQLTPLDRTRDTHLLTENRRQLTQIAIAGFLAANAMWIAVALYAGDYSGLEPATRYFLGLIGTALGVAAAVGPGRVFFKGASASLRTRTPHMDLPVALGLAVGTLAGLINALLGRGHVYFDTLAMLVFLLLIGRWIQFRQHQRAARAVDLLLRITPRHASLVGASGTTSLVLSERLVPGDTIRIAAGESLAADGVVLSGSSQLDRSLLTGESVAIRVEPGDCVAAGTVNLATPLQVRVTAVGRESRIGQVMQAVESAATEKTPIVQFADRIGGVFVLVVMSLAAITCMLWIRSSPAAAISHATAMLIVACPCALALATPLAISVGIGRAAKANILIRDGSAMQLLAKPGRIWFDKTGTLTEGRQRVSTVWGDIESLRLACSIEHECQHPIASALVREAHRRQLQLSPGRLHRVRRGGIEGQADGCSLLVGNRELLQSEQIGVSTEIDAAMQAMVASGESPVLIAVDGEARCVLGITDPLREDARRMVTDLLTRGWRLGILSGDHPQIVARVAEQLGIPAGECHGSLSPEEKLATIRQSRASGQTTVMVGDGANDAAALAAADVGVAVRGGAEVSLQAAPVFIGSGQLASIINLVRGSARVTHLIYWCLLVSLTYNVLAVLLAMCGWISPLIAAVLMPISSVSVLTIAFAFRSFERRPSMLGIADEKPTRWEPQSGAMLS